VDTDGLQYIVSVLCIAYIFLGPCTVPSSKASALVFGGSM